MGNLRVRAVHIPTLTAVLLSSSEARLPPILLLMLKRLELRLGRIMALAGRLPRAGGDVGGESMVVRPRQRRSSGKGVESLCTAAVVGFEGVKGRIGGAAVPAVLEVLEVLEVPGGPGVPKVPERGINGGRRHCAIAFALSR